MAAHDRPLGAARTAALTAAPRAGLALVRVCCLAGVLLVALLACSLLLPAPLSIVTWSPGTDHPALASLEVWIEFSVAPDPAKAEQAFSLTENGRAVSGRFSWAANRMRFEPNQPFSPGNDYAMTVGQSVETSAGSSLEKEFLFEFTTREETGRPRIVSLIPADGSALADRSAPITVGFSEPVDPATFYAAFSIAPKVAGAFSWAPDTLSCTFAPVEQYAWQTEYSITIRAGLSDASGNTLAEDFHARFTVGTDTTAPFLNAVTNAVSGAAGGVTALADDPADAIVTVTSGWEAAWGFVISFSEPVMRDAIERYVSFEPGWVFRIASTAVSDSAYILQPTQRLSYGTLYSLTVRKGIPDTQGNVTDQDSVYRFLVNGNASTPPAPARLRFLTNPTQPPASAVYADYAPDDAFSGLALDPSEYPVSATRRSHFDIYLSTALGASIDPISVMESLSFAATNGCASISIVAVQVSGFTDPQPLANPGTAVVRAIVDISNHSASGVVTLHLADSFEDSFGNPMAEALALPLLK
jgi:hypothetical protein